jgi:hypothetical protein
MRTDCAPYTANLIRDQEPLHERRRSMRKKGVREEGGLTLNKEMSTS